MNLFKGEVMSKYNVDHFVAVKSLFKSVQNPAV